ncbi:DNA polymerase ligase N-terminal domain-containing protein [Methanobacterium sp. ACI-7]|uniref:DNA polymerase ligase N-terminal domain-containing protein n=1 Tax=unclassified Methanobacterium TaxID=2627676 RepID=UPI0039C36E42
MENSLKKYKEKRDFDKTPEPFSSEKISSDSPRFVIQKHDASRLHYDFRLEVGGVLKSWSIPKGPSIDPGQKRLAVPTEDHPIDYIDFEGIIPEGNYGAGTVIIWDTGTYKNTQEEKGKLIKMEEAIENGHVNIELEGEKLKGKYALIYTGRGKRKFWLLLKKKDEYANSEIDILESRPESVLSGLTIEELAGDKENKQDI